MEIWVLQPENILEKEILTIDVSRFSSVIYFINFTINDSKHIKKLIVEKSVYH
jgi:hypothetical protein